MRAQTDQRLHQSATGRRAVEHEAKPQSTTAKGVGQGLASNSQKQRELSYLTRYCLSRLPFSVHQQPVIMARVSAALLVFTAFAACVVSACSEGTVSASTANGRWSCAVLRSKHLSICRLSFGSPTRMTLCSAHQAASQRWGARDPEH